MKFTRFLKTVLLLPMAMAFNCTGFFGGGTRKASTPPTPVVTPAPAPAPIPDITEKEPEAKTVRDDESRKLRQRGGISGTVLTSPLGMPSETGNWLGKSLLGKSGM